VVGHQAEVVLRLRPIHLLPKRMVPFRAHRAAG
jgi:hypothetical protein